VAHYVSVVDSGNLCGHLIALKQGCLELPDDELFNARVIAGLQDTLDAVAAESSQLAASMQRTDAITISNFAVKFRHVPVYWPEHFPYPLPGGAN